MNKTTHTLLKYLDFDIPVMATLATAILLFPSTKITPYVLLLIIVGLQPTIFVPALDVRRDGESTTFYVTTNEIPVLLIPLCAFGCVRAFS